MAKFREIMQYILSTFLEISRYIDFRRSSEIENFQQYKKVQGTGEMNLNIGEISFCDKKNKS